MSKQPFNLNRYDATQALADLSLTSAVRLDPAEHRPRTSGEQGVVSVAIGGDGNEAIDIYFPAPNGVIDPSWIEAARDVLLHVVEMDNMVQVSLADSWAKSGFESKHYDMYLAYISLGPESATLAYFGNIVNTEWDARFVKKSGTWVRVKAES